MTLLRRKAGMYGAAIILVLSLTACGGSKENNVAANGESGTAKTADATKETVSSLSGKYLPYSADLGDLVMSYTDLEEADMVENNYLVINDDEVSGEFGTGSDTPSKAEIDVEHGTITADGITVGFEVQEDGSLKINMTYGDEYDDDEEKLYIYYAKEGEAYEKAKKDSEANSSFAEWREEAESESMSQTEDNTDTSSAVEGSTEAVGQAEDMGAMLGTLPSGDGITEKQTMINVYDQMWNSDDKFDLTYEMVKDMIGVDGELIAGESSEEKHYYLWYGEGSNVILTVVFKGNNTDGYTLNSYAISGDYERSAD